MFWWEPASGSERRMRRSEARSFRKGALLVVGLGPLSLGFSLHTKAVAASEVIGTNPSPERRGLAGSLGAATLWAPSMDSASMDCSEVGASQLTALQNTHGRGHVALGGEGGQLNVDVSEVIIHRQLSVRGSRVNSKVKHGGSAGTTRPARTAPCRRSHQCIRPQRRRRAISTCRFRPLGKIVIVWQD